MSAGPKAADAARGVYRVPAVGGAVELCCVSRDGRILATTQIAAECFDDDAVRLAEAWLDAHDPPHRRPDLRLVRQVRDADLTPPTHVLMIAFPELPRARSCATTITTRAGLDLADGSSLELELTRTVSDAPGSPLRLTLMHVPVGGTVDMLTISLPPADVYGFCSLLDTLAGQAVTNKVLLPPVAAATAADLIASGQSTDASAPEPAS